MFTIDLISFLAIYFRCSMCPYMASRRNNFASHLMKAHKRVLPDIGEIDCLPLLKSSNGTTEQGGALEPKSGESEVISRYLGQIDAVPYSELGDSSPLATPTLESLPNSEGMNVPTLENCDSDSTTTLLNLVKEPTPGIPIEGPTLREVIRSEAESILSKVLGSNRLATDNYQQAKKSYATSESSESSGRDSTDSSLEEFTLD